MKNTLTEIKNTLWRINSGVDEAEDHIRGLEHKEAENTQSEQQKEKRTPQKHGWAKEPLGKRQIYQHLNHRGAGRRRERARN